MFFLPCIGVLFDVKYIRFGKWIIYNSRDILSLHLRSSFNKFWIRRLQIHFLLLAFFTHWEEGIGGLSWDNWHETEQGFQNIKLF